MTERLGGGWLRSSTVWTKEQMHRRKDTSPMSGPEKKKIVKHSWATQAYARSTQRQCTVCDGWKLLKCTLRQWVRTGQQSLQCIWSKIGVCVCRGTGEGIEAAWPPWQGQLSLRTSRWRQHTDSFFFFFCWFLLESHAEECSMTAASATLNALLWQP